MDQVYMYRCVCMQRVYMYVRVFIGVYAWIKFICIREYVKVCLHAASLYVCASVYRCICMDQVYMYTRVCKGVSACSEFICMCECL